MFAIKTIKYLIEALVVYFSFLLIFLIGLKNSRILFSYIFNKIGPIIRSTNIVNNNLQQVFGEQDKNTMKFVLIHELAHVMTLENGHPPEFWKNMGYFIYWSWFNDSFPRK